MRVHTSGCPVVALTVSTYLDQRISNRKPRFTVEPGPLYAHTCDSRLNSRTQQIKAFFNLRHHRPVTRLYNPPINLSASTATRKQNLLIGHRPEELRNITCEEKATIPQLYCTGC